MKKECGRCKGQGGRYVNRRSSGFFGIGTSSRDWVRCDACGGSGENPDYRSKRCSGCWNMIEYSAKTPSEKVPNYCPTCRDRMRAEKERERQNRQSQPRHEHHESRPSYDNKWAEKTCPGLKGGSYCGNTIKYRTDWDHIPDICPSCREKAKNQKASRDAEFRTGRCEKCGGETRYHMSKQPPKLCKSCFEQREANKRTKPCGHCGKELVYYVGEKEFDYCRDCNNLRVRVDREGNTLQARAKDGTVLFTFGRCSAPRDDRHGVDADRRRAWANQGCYWVSMPGTPHETFIIASNPVVNGFIEQSQHVFTSYSTAALRNAWQTLAIAVLGSND